MIMPPPLPWIAADAPVQAFPDVSQAMHDPNGLLAAGGSLSCERLHYAYQHGIFPWYSPGEPILWWSPDPRMVLFPEQLKISKSFAKTLRKQAYEIRNDTAFAQVISACAEARDDDGGTWISAEMRDAYIALHQQGLAHSVECWQDGALVGGLYGLAIGAVFCGESMFSRAPDASKIALHALCKQSYQLIDGQVESRFLAQMGFAPISRQQFVKLLQQLG